MDPILEFEALDSHIDLTFWLELNKQKLDKLKLSDDPIDVKASYQLPVENAVRFLTYTKDSLAEEEKKSIGGLLESKMDGMLINTNTIEDFNTLNPDEKMDELILSKFKDAVKTGSWKKNTEQLNSFLLCSFADLKSYLYRYIQNTVRISSDSFSVSVTKGKKLHKVIKGDDLDVF